MYTRDQLIAFLNAGQSVIVCKKLYTSAADLPDQNTLDTCAVAGQINVLDSFLGLSTPTGLPSNNQTIKYNSTTGAWVFADLSAGGGSWNAIENPTGNLSLSMGTTLSTLSWASSTSTNNLFNLTTADSSNGTGYLLNISTGTGSTVKPFRVRAVGIDSILVGADGNVTIGGSETSVARSLTISSLGAATLDVFSNSFLNPVITLSNSHGTSGISAGVSAKGLNLYGNSTSSGIFIDANDLVGINKMSSVGAQIHIVSGSASRVGMHVESTTSSSVATVLIKNGASGTGNLLETRDSSNTLLNYISSVGDLYLRSNRIYFASNAADAGSSIVRSGNSLNINTDILNVGNHLNVTYDLSVGRNTTIAGTVVTSPSGRSSGSANYFRMQTPADTTLTASTESIGIAFGGNSSNAPVTRQWATGALATQREVLFVAPTYAFAGASTLTTAATVAISAAPIAGTNATITNPLALWTQAGNVAFGSIGAGFWWDNSNARVGIGTTTPAFVIDVATNINSEPAIRIYNAAATNGAAAWFRAGNSSNAADSFQMGVMGTGFSSLGAYMADTAVLAADVGLSGGINFSAGATTGQIRFYSGGYTNQRVVIDENGLVGINKFSAIGAQLHTVSGSASRISGLFEAAASNSAAVLVSKQGSSGTGDGLQIQNSSGSVLQAISSAGDFSIPARTSGVASYFRIITPADTTLTASTESIGAQFGGNTSAATVTRQWAAGALTTQREIVFVRPTYSFASASTLTNAATVAITGAPAAGTNATITNSYALLIESGVLRVASGGVGVAAVPQSNGIAANGWIDSATGVTIQDSNHGFYVAPITSYFDGASSYRDIWKFGGTQGVAFLAGNTTLIAEFKASNGNVYFSGTLDVAGGTVNIKNGTAPTTSFTDGVRLYAEDVASSSTLKVRSEAGNVVTFPEITDTLLGTNAQINSQTGTTYTLVAADNGKVITCDNVSGITVTVPSGLGAGFNCLVMQLGTGQVTFSASGTTVNNRQSHTKIAGRYGVASLVAYISNTFNLSGDTSA